MIVSQLCRQEWLMFLCLPDCDQDPGTSKPDRRIGLQTAIFSDVLPGFAMNPPLSNVSFPPLH